MIADILEVEANAWKPLERVPPSVFAERHRDLKEGTTPRPGKFSHEGFEFMVDIEDSILEAIETGKRWVFMKPAQIGGSETVINAVAWVQTFHAGPTLYMTSTDDVAKEFSRDRLSHLCATCEPLSKKFLAGRGARDEIYTKRFVDGKIAICGGKSINNFQSQPYRNVFIDEADMLAAQIAGLGDPIKLADLRTAAYAIFGSTFVGAFAHPSTKEGPVGRLYYEESDQRRAFVRCPHDPCPGEFWLQWDHVRVCAREGQTPAAAERDPSCYRYFAPCCGAELSDGERLAIARKARQKSTLPPEVARTKAWIGVHISHLYTKPLLELAREHISGIGKPSVARVVANKVLGDVYEDAETGTTVDTWRELAIPEGQPGAYKLGTVPAGVQWLTAGQDSRKLELHWTVWGWGFVPSEAGAQVLCGWLIDYGVEPGPAVDDPDRGTLRAQDLEVFDQVLYAHLWPAVEGPLQYFVAQALHDSGWQPIAAYEYCRAQLGRAVPSKGLATDDRSSAPVIGWGAPPKWKVGEEEISDPNLRRADLNTFLLKQDFTGLPSAVFVGEDRVPRPPLALPYDVSPAFLDHLASERLVLEDGRRVWKKRTHQNHWWDCTVMAYASALNLAPASPSSAMTSEPPRDETPREGGWSTGARGGRPWL